MRALLFQGFELLLFFGAIVGFGVWQLIELEREKKKRDSADSPDPTDDTGSP